MKEWQYQVAKKTRRRRVSKVKKSLKHKKSGYK